MCCPVGQIESLSPSLPKRTLSTTVKEPILRLFCGFCRNVGHIATEVSLAPNLLSLCGCQSHSWLYIAKTPAANTKIK